MWQEAPADAGVYLFLDAAGDVLYVGKAANLRRRLQQHAGFGPATSRLHRRYAQVRQVRWELAPDEETAAYREADLIWALRPPFNAESSRPRPAMFIAMSEDRPETLRFELTATGGTYGCFPHLGKGMASRAGVVCSDGYVAFLRLLWAASGMDTHVPAVVTRSAPPRFDVAVAPSRRRSLHALLSGVSARLLEELAGTARHLRPAYMQPALARDLDSARGFFAAGPHPLRALRLQHRLPPGPLSEERLRGLVTASLCLLDNH